MFVRRLSNKSRAQSAPATKTSPMVEWLETRSLLSAAVDPILYPNIVRDSTSGSSTAQGLTPAQIKKAYNFDQISLANGVTGNGQGQTIAIVDAYNDPNIAADLAVFDSEFNLPAASLKVVNQTGGTSLPSNDAGWAGEISLDVEWAHAIAPGASILLVEATGADVSDLMAGVNYARHAADVSVVSMSWGGSEFFSWGGGGESSSQLNYDPIFTTPAGHQGVTFIAAAGDSGQYSGVQWPASSPNVLSVGGTTLTTSSTGAYVSEQSWSGTNGGFSQVEVQPAYQDGVQSTGVRVVPDVAYNADPNSGYAVYDSVAYQGESGWIEVGGTSAGAPQWGGLIAIADQARVAAGETTLDGATQTLEILYNLYSAPDTSGYSTYTTYFNDIIDQTFPNPWQWWWGSYGNSSTQATAGYDAITGLGTPHANMIVDALVGSAASKISGTGSTTSAGSGTSSGTGTGTTSTTTPQALPDTSLVGTLLTDLPTTAVTGQSGSLLIDLTNTSATKFTGPVTITLYAASSSTLTGSEPVLGTLSIGTMKLAGGHSKKLRLNYTYASTLAAGTYTLVATVAATGTDTSPTQFASPSAVAVAQPTVSLSTTFNNANPIAVTSGHRGYAGVTITNSGNVTASGTISLSLFATALDYLDSTATLISNVITRTIRLRAGHSITLHIGFTAPLNQTPGNYNILAKTSSATTVTDDNNSNDIAVIATVVP